MATAAHAELPPVADADKTLEALRMRKRFLEQMNEKLTPELRKWLVQGLVADVEKAAG